MSDDDVAALCWLSARFLIGLALGTVFLITGFALTGEATGSKVPSAFADLGLLAAAWVSCVGPFAVAFVGTALAFAD
ncbi:hypothetical protein [Frigidibacter sp. MR17.24]|uniref:hypothetical protein n=1 Tax=Frigidibacter sp. MR17.24 TaxID=3127345 RepID=UPI003012DBC6